MTVIKKVKNNKRAFKPLDMKKYRVPKRCRDGYRKVDELINLIALSEIERETHLKYDNQKEADWLNERIVGYNKELDEYERQGFVVERDVCCHPVLLERVFTRGIWV